jgi:hypothetical protein
MTSSPTAISCCIACLRIWHRHKCEHSLPGYAASMRLAARILRRSVVFPDTVGSIRLAARTVDCRGRYVSHGRPDNDRWRREPRSAKQYSLWDHVVGSTCCTWSTKLAWSRGLTTRIGGNLQTVAVAARNNAMAPWARRDGWSWSCPGFANGLQRGLQCSHAWRRARLHDAVISKTW